MKDKVLEILKDQDDFISGEKLSDRFDMTRANIWKYINTLKEEGYLIESVPRRGYKLVSSPDILSKGEVLPLLKTKYMGRDLYYFKTLDSTNNKAKELEEDLKEGSIIISEEQTKGRGRMGRTWISPNEKGIYTSIFLEPKGSPGDIGPLTLMGAGAVSKALDSYGVKSSIKWPNDIIVNNKKVGGILTEMSSELNKINHIIMGIGLNVSLDKEDIDEDLRSKVTSLKLEGYDLVRKELLAKILEEFEVLYDEFKNTSSISKTIDIVDSRLLGRDTRVRLISGPRIEEGLLVGLSPRGELLVEVDKEGLRNISSGEISLELDGIYL